MDRDHLVHAALGVAVSLLAFVITIFLETDTVLNSVAWGVVVFGLLWAMTIGHGLYYLSIPVGLCIYLTCPPIKLRNGNAMENSAVVRAYSYLPDRIVLIREFPSLNTLEGRSFFLPEKVREKTERMLCQSSAIPITIDASLAATTYGDSLPDLSRISPQSTERDFVDGLHATVGRLWRERLTADGHEGIFHLAGWYALLVDQYWRIPEKTWFEHAVL